MVSNSIHGLLGGVRTSVCFSVLLQISSPIQNKCVRSSVEFSNCEFGVDAYLAEWGLLYLYRLFTLSCHLILG